MLRVAEQSAKTDTGRQRRENEDAYFARAPLFVIADGMGGGPSGEVASRLAVEAFEPGLPDSGASAEKRLAETVRDANVRIHEYSLGDADREGMGTTLSAAYVDEREIAIAHVGDSRIYRLRGDVFERLTEDHTLVEELVRGGKLTPEEAEDHPQGSIITRALGNEPDVEVDAHTHPARAGDVYLICSDGLTGMVPEARVAEILRGAPDLEAAGRALVDAANRAGGRDNITVVLFRLEDVGAAEASGEQATETGAGGPSVAEVRAAAAAPAAAPAPARSAPRRRRAAPAAPGPVSASARRPRRRRAVAALAALTIAVPVLIGAWIASRAVYFVGTASDGEVAVFRGLPYDLPAGVHLYEQLYVSGVPAATLAPARRRKLLDHQLRSRGDATDLVRSLELGRVQQ
jgi:protein phosphatase